MITDISDTQYISDISAMVPDISDTRYLLYPILMIPNISDISDIWIYSLCLTGATTMPRAPFFIIFLMADEGGKVEKCQV